MNTVHSTSATLASLNSTDVYDSDGIVPRESPPLQQKTLKLRITPSPPPKVTEVSRSLQTSSPTTSRHRSSSNRRRKAKPSLGQTVLLQYMAGGRNPDIAHFASQQVPSDGSEDEDEDDEEDDRNDDIGRTRESTSEFINNDSDSDKDDEDDEDENDEPSYESSRRKREDESSQNHRRLFLGNARKRNAADDKPPRLEQQQQRQGKAQQIHSEERKRSPRGKERQQASNSGSESDDSNDAMSLDEPSPPPPRPHQQPQHQQQHQQQQQEKPERNHEHEKALQQGQDHERQRHQYQEPHTGSAAEAATPFVNLAAIAMAAAGAIGRPGHVGPAESTVNRTASSTGTYSTSPAETLGATSDLAPPPPRSPGAKRDYNGVLKPISMGPGTLRLDSSISSPQPQHGRPAVPMDAPGSRSGGGLSPEQMRRQYSSSSQNAVPAYSPRPGSTASYQDQQQSDQSQLLTPASAITPGTMSASSTSFPPILPRDDRSVVGSTGSASLATPSSTHSPNEYHSPFSPNGTGMAVSPAQVTAFSPRSQPDFHLSRQSTSSSLPPLPPIQPYNSPRHDINSAISPMAANTPAGHTPSNHSSNGSVGQPQHNLLPPIREHLAGPLTESSPTGSESRRPPPFLPPSAGYTRLPSMAHSHHSSPTSPDEVYRRNSDLASPNSSVSNVGSHPGSAQQYYFPPSAPSSNYGGSRRGTTDYGGDTPTSEPHYGTPGSTGRPAASPGRLLNPMVASPLPGAIVLPSVRHDSMQRQQPTIESLTSHMQHSPNGPHIPPMQQQQSHLRPPPPPPPPPQQQPPPQSHTAAHGQYKCDVPGCTAAPFPTQYLLNSHANVHSSARPHYCPVRGCPRSETGKGFKRKNEMIRHGLVHQSPGYVCPFCPDREHKYPRPDNLQRHVRVHHKDRSKDDPLLRDVLAQRAEGPSRGRRRRL